MDIMLIAGLWLRSSIWERVGRELDALGHRALAVELPGVDDASPSATLDDQLRAVLAAVDDAERPLVVGHSAACTLAWMAADRRPDDIRGVVMIGGMPGAHGSPYAAFFPSVDGAMPFPGWEPFDGPDSDDLDEAARARIEAGAVDVLDGVSNGIVELGDPRRFDVPVVVVCPEFTAEQAREWLAAGEMPELESVRRLSFVDIDSGHWPMVSCPDELARAIDRIAAVVISP
jgi:pimeloyl-ACP methyl ester carboxylesterase